LLTHAPESFPDLPCRVARCARSCPISLGAIRPQEARVALATPASLSPSDEAG
jgi:hypothetical protein